MYYSTGSKFDAQSDTFKGMDGPPGAPRVPDSFNELLDGLIARVRRDLVATRGVA